MKRLILACLLVILVTCTKPQPQVKYIAVIGDSISADGTYVKELNRLCKYHIFTNIAVSGVKSRYIKQTMISNVEKYDSFIVQGGVNNIEDPTMVIIDLFTAYSTAKIHGKSVVALTLTPWKFYPSCTTEKIVKTKVVNGWIMKQTEFATPVNIYKPLAALHDPDLLSRSYRGDCLHPTKEGQLKIAEIIYNQIYKEIEQ